MTTTKYIVVLISGNGTNLQYIIDCIENNILKSCCIKAVISNKKDAYGLERAKQHKIPTFHFPFIKSKMERSEYDSLLANKVESFKPDLVILAGWMRILTTKFIERFNKIINLHPALPECFPGTHAIERAYKSSRDFYEKYRENMEYYTGTMCHYVIEEVDAGKVLSAKNVLINKEDSLDDLRIKIAHAEKVVLLEGIIKSLSII